MATRMYKAIMGWSEYKDGDEKHSPTHRLLTEEEYDDMVDEIRRLKSLVSQREQEKDAAVKKINDAAVAYKQKADADALAVKTKATQEVAEAEAERDRQTNLNKNLLRITRERANARRGLQPKKEHHGYRFSGKIMQTKTISGYDKKTGAIYADVWTATLETPYDGTIPINQIRDLIFDDLMGVDGILEKLYVKYWKIKGTSTLWKGTYADAIKDSNDQNYLFDYKFMVNPKSGLWEIQITTTKSIRALSEMMNPPKDKKKNGGNSGQKKVSYADDSNLSGW